MRTIQTPNFTIQIPNATHFAFNPAFVNVSSATANVAAVTVSASDDQGRTWDYDESRDMFDGKAQFNIARFLQMMFDGEVDRIQAPSAKIIAKSRCVVHVELKVTVYYPDAPQEESNTYRIDAVFGGLMRGESTGGVIRRPWFVNYPFTLDFTGIYNDPVLLSVDGQAAAAIPDFWNNVEGTTQGWATQCLHGVFPVGQFVQAATVSKTARISVPNTVLVANDVETLGPTDFVLEADCTRGDSSKHVYLRWIDNQGRICYYLFRRLGDSTAVTGTSWRHDSGEVPSAYIDGTAVETPTRQALSAQKSVQIGAKLVDGEMYAFLLSAAKSAIIDAFDGYSPADGSPLWHRVNVVAATYAQTPKTRQDFTMTITEPEQNLQML